MPKKKAKQTNSLSENLPIELIITKIEWAALEEKKMHVEEYNNSWGQLKDRESEWGVQEKYSEGWIIVEKFEESFGK